MSAFHAVTGHPACQVRISLWHFVLGTSDAGICPQGSFPGDICVLFLFTLRWMAAPSAAPASAVLSGTPQVWFSLPAPSLLIAQLHFHLCWPIPSFRKVSGFITGGEEAARLRVHCRCVNRLTRSVTSHQGFRENEHCPR